MQCLKQRLSIDMTIRIGGLTLMINDLKIKTDPFGGCMGVEHPPHYTYSYLFHASIIPSYPPLPPSLVPPAAPSAWINSMVESDAILMLVIALSTRSVVRVLTTPLGVRTARLCVRVDTVVVLRVARIFASIRHAAPAVRWTTR
jgi:hypothetical protein